jgi:hypothetical protein
MKINSKADVEAYLNHDKIKCLECGKLYSFLPVHINRMHQLTAEAYRLKHNLPAGTPLAGLSYRQVQRDKLNRMIKDGVITYDHLPQAVENAMGAKRANRTSYDLEAQARIAKNIVHERLPGGAKRADGRDADKAREYQQKYRLKHKEKNNPDK